MSDNNEAEAEVTEKQEKTMAERAQEVGRDGAYLECDAADLVTAHRRGDLQKASIVVIRAARIELSLPVDVKRLVSSIDVMRSCLDRGVPYVEGMSDEQGSAQVVRQAFVTGLVMTQAASQPQ
jgi:hypothetical protein